MHPGKLSTVESRHSVRAHLLVSLLVTDRLQNTESMDSMETLFVVWLLMASNGLVSTHPGLSDTYSNFENESLKTDETLESSNGELEVDPDYPTEMIEEAVAKAPKEVTAWLRKEVTNVRNRRSAEHQENEFQQRICPVRIRNMLLPRVARRSIDPQDFRLYHPVNLPEHVQRVKTSHCVQNFSSVTFMDEVDHQCKQEYVNIPLISVVTGSTDLVVRFFSFPHGCSCFVREN